MRFATVTVPKSEPQGSPAAEFVRRLLGTEKPVDAQTPKTAVEIPADLDQRVRLVGEW